MPVAEESSNPGFAELVKLRAYDDHYIDTVEEKDILRQGLGLGMDHQEARMALVKACQAGGFILESDVLGALREELDRLVTRDGRIGPGAFKEACALGRRLVGDVKGEVEVGRMACRLVDDHGLPLARGWFSDWYRALKRQLGLI